MLAASQLAGTVGAASGRVSRANSCWSTTTLPAAVMDALEEHGVLVFPELHIDDETQVAFSTAAR